VFVLGKLGFETKNIDLVMHFSAFADVDASVNGQTKLDVETMPMACAPAHGLGFSAFRYFNATEALNMVSTGEDHDLETHPIPLVIDAATGGL
jgi:UDP-glucose 4-epimerase